MNKIENRITFWDYDDEGLFVYNLSRIENKNPYLICFLEDDEADYRLWDKDTYEVDDFIWFHKDASKLKEVVRFDVQQLNYQLKYIVFEVTNKQAYLNIWSMASHDLGIAEYTISGNCDIEEIINSIKSDEFYNDEPLDFSLVPWAYTQRYGGGSDEHYAVFYSKIGEHVGYMIKQVNQSKKARFNNN